MHAAAHSTIPPPLQPSPHLHPSQLHQSVQLPTFALLDGVFASHHHALPCTRGTLRIHRFQADIAFDGEELARRALDRCGRTRLFKALDAAVTRHDPHALDALLMQFAAVIVSTTGAEVDRIEREIMVCACGCVRAHA